MHEFAVNKRVLLQLMNINVSFFSILVVDFIVSVYAVFL